MLSDGTSTYTYIMPCGYDAADRLTRVTNGGNLTQFAYNGLGNRLQQTISVRLLTNGAGSITGEASYTPFGDVMGSTAGSAFGFAGEQMDDTGLQYLRARYYAPEMGRFLTTDPYAGRQAVPYSLHPYQYGYSNPVRYVDPSGEDVCGGLAAAAALASGGTAAVPVFGVCEAAVVTAAVGVACFASGVCQAAGEAVVEGVVGISETVVDYFTPQPEEVIPEVEVFPLDVGIDSPTYTPPGQVDNWWEDGGVLSTPIDDSVELHPEGFSLEIPGIELDIFPLSEEQQEPLFCATDGRPRISGHAEQRRQEGRRVAQGFGDAQSAVQNDVFYDTRTDRFIVRGPRGREHIFEYDTGDQVTTVEGRSRRWHNELLRRGERRRVTESEYEQFRRLFPRN